MMQKIRMEENTRLDKENKLRREQEKAEKKDEIKKRETRDAAEKEAKRKMLEEYQAAMQAQMEVHLCSNETFFFCPLTSCAYTQHRAPQCD